MLLKVRGKFEAAHSLKVIFGGDHHCAGMHGHSFKVELTIDEGDKIIDFSDVKEALNELTEYLDHTVLNDVLEVAPTAEGLAKWFAEGMNKCYDVEQVDIWETESNCAIWLKPKSIAIEGTLADF